MHRLLAISFTLVFPLVGLLPASQQKARQKTNRPPSIESFSSSANKIRICPFYPNSAVSDPPEVQLLVTATDPDGDSLEYNYSMTEGTISGKGKSVVWDLRDLPRGPHEIFVIVTDGKGGKAGKADAVLTVTTVDSGTCDPPPPPCPVIKVSCSDEMDKSKPFIFSITKIEGKGYTSTSFYWKVNAGRIVKGQNSREIEVTTTGANGFKQITATVEVGGFDPGCVSTVSCSTKIIW